MYPPTTNTCVWLSHSLNSSRVHFMLLQWCPVQLRIVARMWWWNVKLKDNISDADAHASSSFSSWPLPLRRPLAHSNKWSLVFHSHSSHGRATGRSLSLRSALVYYHWTPPPSTGSNLRVFHCISTRHEPPTKLKKDKEQLPDHPEKSP